MFSSDLWSPGVLQGVWTLATIAALLVTGAIARYVVGARLSKLASRTSGDWDDILVSEVGRRIPLWSVLLGLHLSQARWPLTGAAHQQASLWLGALGVASVTFAGANILTRLVVSYGSRGAVPVSRLTLNLIRLVVTILGALVIVRSFGYEITPVLTVLGVGGLAVALALQDPLSNLFAGLFVSLAGFVRLGDYVKLDSGAEGYVVDFNWRSARIRQLSDNLLEVPNSKLAQAVVTNFTQPTPELGIGLDLLIDTANDLDLVERVATDVANAVVGQVAGAVTSAAPSVRFSGVSELGVKLGIGVRVRGFTDQFLVRHELIKRLHAEFRAHGITFVQTRPAPPKSGV
ncbi:MAG: mechanosensitive ion channel family protein [Acidobacteriota bacterium]